MYPGQIPQVEYVGDDEELTAVRTPTYDRSSQRWSTLTGGAVGAVVAFVVVVGIGAFGYLAFLAPQSRQQTSSVSTPSPTPDQAAEIRRAEKAAKDAEIAMNRRMETPTPRPTATPIDIDAERAKIEEREQRQRVANAANYANQVYANQAANRPANASWPPQFDSRGRPLRAICNSGTLSYWQGDRAFTCMAQGGVRVWYRN